MGASTARAARIVSIILGLAAVALGVATVGGAAWLLVAGASTLRDTEEGRFLVGTALIPSGLLLLAIGGAALWLAARAGPGRAARAVALPPWWLSAIVFGALVAAGWALLRAGQWWLFYPVAALAAFAPAAATGSLPLTRAAPPAPRPSWRRILSAFAWGALVTPVVAITIECLLALGALAAVIAGIASGGPATTETLRRTIELLQGQTLTPAQSQALMRALLETARQPAILLWLGFVVVFAGPVTEELCKFLAVVLFGRARAGGRARRDSVLTIVLIGLASGLGFATLENIFYAAQAGPSGWAALTLFRGATPLIHGTASALFALGWARQLRNPRGWALAGGAAGAMALHAAWNLCAVGLVAAGALESSGADAARGLAAVALIVVFGLLALLALLRVALLVWLGRTLGREARAEDEAPPPAATLVEDGRSPGSPGPAREPIVQSPVPVQGD